ncbi:hypothetical protein [Nostoc sp. TCL26-01]|nr:hypothetical protein [Nostoc sp. TCL26-01]
MFFSNEIQKPLLQDSSVTFFIYVSYEACTQVVLVLQQRLRSQLEQEP